MQQKGTTIVPFSFYHMATDTLIQHIETLVNTMLADEPEYFLVQVKIKPVNNIKVFLDGDNGITIEKCVRFNRKLYKTIEELALFNEGDFSLELSSPGVSEPLKLIRQYTKNIGRFVEVLFIDGTAKVRGVSEAPEGRRSTLGAAAVPPDAYRGDTALGVEAAWQQGRWLLQAEALQRRLGAGNGVAARSARGAYVQAAWSITGEARRHDEERARFGRARPLDTRWAPGKCSAASTGWACRTAATPPCTPWAWAGRPPSTGARC